jgi:YVTN family beta-propeller protein
LKSLRGFSKNEEDIVHSNDSNGSCAFWAQGFAALWAVLVLAAAFSARPAEAADSFSFVTNVDSKEISMFDTATNKVVAVIPATGPLQIAVTPDGKYAYVVNEISNDVLVITTATNKVMATVPVGKGPYGVAIALDGKHAYVLNRMSNTISVIDTATYVVVATVPGGNQPFGELVTPDGKSLDAVK